MKHVLGRALSSWVFWVLCVVLLGAGSFCFAILTTPISEDALKLVVKQEMFKHVEIKNLTLKSKNFDLLKLEWSFELSANIEKIWGLPIKVQNLSLEGSKKMFRDSEVKRAVLRFAEDEKLFRGGLVVHKDSQDQVVWDLSNLDFRMGSLEKKIGTATYLHIESATETQIKAQLLFDQLKIPFEITHSQDTVVIQIPKTTLKTQKQKLPFKMFSQIPSSGEWTVASRIEMAGDMYSEASSIEVSKALISLANVDSSLLKNGRGVGILSAKLVSSENFLNGSVELNLDNATFELNSGRFFKVDTMPFSINAQIDQNAAQLKIESAKGILSAMIDREGAIEAQLKNLDASLIPDTEKMFGKGFSGEINGKAQAKLSVDALGTRSVALEALQAKDSRIIVENFSNPIFKTRGPSTFVGDLSFVNGQKTVAGVFDFTNSEINVENAYQKAVGEELKLKLKAEYVDKIWKTFEFETELEGQFLKATGNDKKLTLKFPNTFKFKDGTLVSGTLSYQLCEGYFCNVDSPEAYNLKVSEYPGTGYLQDLKVSGSIVKKSDQYNFSSVKLRWPSGDSLTLEGSLEKFKTANLSVQGDFNYKNFALSNPFLFFKEMPLQKADLDINVTLNHENDEWLFSGKSRLENKKIDFESLQVSQGVKNKFLGRMQFDLEPYLHRNEAATLTATFKNTGKLAAFEGLLMRGTYAANLVLATSGLNSAELLSRLSVRASGDAIVEQLPMTLLISQGLDSYAKEKQKSAANILAKCYPKNMRGKFDFDYNQGRWTLSPSAFQGTDRDSIVKIQGVLGDLSSVNLISHYLPGPTCAAELAACLGDAFPKGGMSFEITGPFKDPETDLDFAFIDQSLERCREIEARREVATENTIDTRDQNERIQELKNFYRSRKLTR
jgi:hypothetical protein